MTTSGKRPLNWRAVTSTFILLCFIFIAISGIILYFAPPGRIAHWTNWTFSGVSKGSWQSVHTVFAFSFIIIAVFHLKHNWKPLISYMKSRVTTAAGLRREMLLSCGFGTLMLILTLSGIPPFSTIMIWSEDLSQSWANADNTPPVPHAEIMTLAELSDMLKVPFEQLAGNLAEHRIVPRNENEILGSLAAEYNKTPNELYGLMLGDRPAGNIGQLRTGGGYGQKSVAQLCAEMDIPVSEALQRLKDSGITAHPNENIRQLALRNNRRPHDLVTTINNGRP
jgi:hypothetical protein